jgi:hypothetical protein
VIVRPLLAVLAAAAASAAEPARSPLNGVDAPPRRGTYVESTLGLFSTLGGTAKLSSAQPFLGISVGRELGTRTAVFLALGIGASSASCFAPIGASGCEGADSFGATFGEVGLSVGTQVARRTLVSLKVVGGVTDLSPGPLKKGASVPDHLLGFHGGAGLALDYDTHLDHFAVGLDALLRYTLARATPSGQPTQTVGIASLALLPRVRYVF